LLDDPALAKRLGEHAARRVEERFSLAAVRQGMLEVYRRVLAPRA
jgi:glycosyltransferase involved in cell wall biosynthesis